MFLVEFSYKSLIQVRCFEYCISTSNAASDSDLRWLENYNLTHQIIKFKICKVRLWWFSFSYGVNALVGLGSDWIKTKAFLRYKRLYYIILLLHLPTLNKYLGIVSNYSINNSYFYVALILKSTKTLAYYITFINDDSNFLLVMLQVKSKCNTNISLKLIWLRIDEH